MTVVPVILAGGIGERFWPMSRSSMPKQLLKLISSRSMAEETLLRIDEVTTCGVKPLIITGEKIARKFKDVIPSSYDYSLISEPVGKNTAPAIALAAELIKAEYGENSVMVVLSADHNIAPKKAFTSAILAGVDLAENKNQLVVFGIRPSRPDTGYGYIQMGKLISKADQNECYVVEKFVEKPDAAKARDYLEAGNYMWNSGIFVWKVSKILDEFSRHMPELSKQAQTLAKNNFTSEAINDFYGKCAKESIDYGILEHSDSVSAVVGKFEWDDIGSWESLSRLHGENESGATVVGENIYEKESDGSIIVNSSPMVVAAIGVKDLVVVTTEDAILVIERSKLPEIKKYLGEMKTGGKFPQNLF
jgi:mannose-1-phosphate guanylyltransferase